MRPPSTGRAAASGPSRGRTPAPRWRRPGSSPRRVPPSASVLPLALYRLAVLRARDSAAYQAARERLLRGGQPSAQMAEAVVDGYRDAASWQGQAVSFLLSANWVRVGGRLTSPAGLMRTAWGMPDLPVPPIRPRYFGIPEAVPRVGIPGEAAGRVVIAENWAAEEWVRRRGTGALLDVLRRLKLDLGPNATLEADGPWILASVAGEAAASPAGFLESKDEIIEDPGTPPLFAVATALHEWQHLVMERHRLTLPGRWDPAGRGDGIAGREVGSLPGRGAGRVDDGTAAAARCWSARRSWGSATRRS